MLACGVGEDKETTKRGMGVYGISRLKVEGEVRVCIHEKQREMTGMSGGE